MTGKEMAFADSWAHFCVHHFNQDGLIPRKIKAHSMA